jgi:CCR4-NOT transcription complex subunit 4
MIVFGNAVPLSTSQSPSPALSSSDFPALNSPEATRREQQQPSIDPDDPAASKAAKKAAKKAAAAEKAAERQKIAQEKAAAKAAERAKIAAEKAAEKEKRDQEKAEQERVLKEEAEAEKIERARVAKERAAVAAIEKEKAEKEKTLKEEREKQRSAQLDQDKAAEAKKSTLGKQSQKSAKRSDADSSQVAAKISPRQSTKQPAVPEPVTQTPLLSKKPKKNRPVAKPIRIPKEEEAVVADTTTISSASLTDTPQLPPVRPSATTESSSNNSRAQSVDPNIPPEPTSVEELLEEIDVQNPTMDLPNHPFFDLTKINPAAKMPLEYGPLVHALSALSVGGGSFANNMPSGSIDNAVSSFQQLLETLTQTISDLLRLLPRTTWDDSSSFDGVLRDMLKGDDFLDDGGDDSSGKEDEVAALTLALERRARWMEVQLSKLEELHRDINTAAVRAVLAFNDNGWDRHGFMPRVGNTLRRFDSIGIIDDSGTTRPMTADELEKKLTVAKEASVFAQTELREVMERMQEIRPIDIDM